MIREQLVDNEANSMIWKSRKSKESIAINWTFMQYGRMNFEDVDNLASYKLRTMEAIYRAN